jgi:hypothetical protein
MCCRPSRVLVYYPCGCRNLTRINVAHGSTERNIIFLSSLCHLGGRAYGDSFVVFMAGRTERVNQSQRYVWCSQDRVWIRGL